MDEQGLGELIAREVTSDPRLADTDGDGLKDPEEFKQGTDPYLADTDRDGESDRRELELGTSPLVPGHFVGLRRRAAVEIRDHLLNSLAEVEDGLLPAREATLLVARQNHARMTVLYRMGAVSRSDLLESESELEAVRAACEDLVTDLRTVEDLLGGDLVYLEETLEGLDEALDYFPGWLDLPSSSAAAADEYELASVKYEQLLERF